MLILMSSYLYLLFHQLHQGWNTIDLTYVKINDSHQGQGVAGKGGTLRRSWDGLAVTPSPRVTDLAAATRRRIELLTEGLDQPLYGLARSKFESQVRAPRVFLIS